MREAKYQPIVYVLFGLLLILANYTNKTRIEKRQLIHDTTLMGSINRRLVNINDSTQQIQLKQLNQNTTPKWKPDK